MHTLKSYLSFIILLFLSIIGNAFASVRNAQRWDIDLDSIMWEKDKSYPGGEIVSKGDFNGYVNYWKSNWWAGPDDVPGIGVDSGGETAWELINSISFGQDREYEWIGWNDRAGKWDLDLVNKWGDWTKTPVGDWGPQIESAEPGAYLPTFKDGAEGVYTIIHENYGMINFAESVQPANEVGYDFPRIRVGWAAKVDVMDDEEWKNACQMLEDGHEILNHSFDHTSAKEYWQWFTHGERLPFDDPTIAKEISNLLVDSSAALQWQELDVDIPYLTYKNADIYNPETLYTTVTFEVADYKYVVDSVFNPDWGEYEYFHKNEGKIRALHKGWSDKFESNVSMIKVLCNKGWTPEAFKVNVKKANDIINQKLYERVNAPRFPKDKRCEYYVYPYNLYSDITHDTLMSYDIVASCGGNDGGKPNFGDFYHPYRLNYDEFYLLNQEGSIVFPDNPYQHYSLKNLVDNAWKSKGYTIRRFTRCMVQDLWGDTDQELWPGDIYKALYRKHFEYLDSLIDENVITVQTPSEAVKYRLTRNSVSDVSLEDKGYSAKLSVTASGCNESYQDEISVIVKMSLPHGKVDVAYGDGEKPRFIPRKMDEDGYVWSIGVNPYEQGGIVYLDFDNMPINDFTNLNNTKNNIVQKINRNRAIINVPAGQYKFQVYDMRGKILIDRSIKSDGILKHIRFDNSIANGNYLVKISDRVKSVKLKVLVK